MNKNYSEKFEKMSVAGKLAAQTLDMITEYIKPGISTNKIDQLCYEFIKDKNIFGMTNTAIKLKNIKKVSFNRKTIAIDWYFFKSILKKGLKAIFTNETESFYRQYKNNIAGLSI